MGKKVQVDYTGFGFAELFCQDLAGLAVLVDQLIDFDAVGQFLRQLGLFRFFVLLETLHTQGILHHLFIPASVGL